MKNDIKEFSKKYGITEKQFHGKDEISGNLYLRSLTSIPKEFNPTVGGNLYLMGAYRPPSGTQ